MNYAQSFALPPRRDRRGIALVITLLLLVLLSAFAVAFFTRMSVEQSSAASYADGVTTRQLADSAVGLVQSQIREATTVPNGAWASQPGMIRTYARAGEGGAVAAKDPYGYYKLYSSNDMTLSDRAMLEAFNADDEIPANWAAEKALFTDLNEPVRLRAQDPNNPAAEVVTERYPIFDPRFAADSDMASPNNLSMHNTTNEFKVEGFSIDSQDNTSDNSRGRMPVRWIYVLRDGTLTAPARSADDGMTAVWEDSGSAGARVPTANNPIVGRIAFWTDDDTSKVNINTAGGFTTLGVNPMYDPQTNGNFDLYAATFWDTPRFWTIFDHGQVAGGATSTRPTALDETKFGEPYPFDTYSLSISQPVTNEFQRYPGHPATTSLGLVFNRSLSSTGVVSPVPRLTTQQLYRLLPRLKPGGSEGGLDRQLANNNASTSYADVSDTRMPVKAERLFASVDEFFFAASQNGTRRQTLNEFLRSPDNTDPRNAIPGMTDDLIGTRDLEEYQGYRFFLTAHSRAPELNLFGRPRVTIWPTWASGTYGSADYSTRRNPIDRLMMFASTLGPKRQTTGSGSASDVGKLFMFQRWNPYSPYDDANIDRNRELLKTYLIGTSARPGLTDQPIPGFTDKESFRSKYNGTDEAGSRDQIITEIFDYIRSGVNLRDGYLADEVNKNRTPYATLVSQNTPESWEIRGKLDRQRYAPRGIVIPAAVSYPSSSVSRGKEVAGFGRFPTVSEISMVFYHAGYIGLIGPNAGRPYWDPREKTTKGVQSHLLRMFFMIETNNPMLGYSRTESYTGDSQRDDRNQTPDRLTQIMQIQMYPSIQQTELDNRRSDFTFIGGLLTNRVDLYSGTFYGGSNAGGMEGVLHNFGLKMGELALQSGGDTGSILPAAVRNSAAPITNDLNDAYNVDAEVYPFQSINVVEVPVKPGTPGSAGPPPVAPTFSQEQQFCRFNGCEATLRIRWGSLDLQFIKLSFPPIESMPLPTDAWWEDPGGFGWKVTGPASGANFDCVNGPATYRTAWQSDRDTRNWPWGSSLLDRPATMKSLAQRIWWINCTHYNYGSSLNQRADSDSSQKYETGGGPEIFNNRPLGFRFDNRWRNIIQPGDVVRSLVPAPADNTDIRTVALMRAKTNDTITFAPLKSYSDPYVRHQQKLRSPHRSDTTNDPYNDLLSNAVATKQSQILRSGGGSPFVFSGNNTTEAHYTNPGPAASPGQSHVTGFAMEPVRTIIPTTGAVTYRWVRKSYGTAGGAVCFGNLVELPNVSKAGSYGSAAADLPALRDNGQMLNGIKRVGRTSTPAGDFDTGFGTRPDGSYVNKPDEGHVVWRTAKSLANGQTPDVSVSNHWNYQFPYYNGDYNDEASDSFLSPMRQLPSPVHFGSLLAGPKTSWQTLCFSPNPMGLSGSSSDHPGMEVEPKDHLLLDLFQMPVVEPYAITEPFSTAGKVNLNCEIMPFTYIQRTTALRAALHGLRVTAVNPNQAASYKGQSGNAAITEKQNYRLVINRDETIKGITAIFSDNSKPVSDRFYRSASQICERFLYPDKANFVSSAVGPKWNRSESQIRNFWQTNTLGGDNTREKPYADLYPRLTTKSNTYTVHLRVQKVRPQRGNNPAAFLVWKDTGDSITAEYRGEVQIERYLDPQDRRFDDDPSSPIPLEERFNVDATRYSSTQPNTRPLEFAYRFRTLGSKRFVPDR